MAAVGTSEAPRRGQGDQQFTGAQSDNMSGVPQLEITDTADHQIVAMIFKKPQSTLTECRGRAGAVEARYVRLLQTLRWLTPAPVISLFLMPLDRQHDPVHRF